MYPRRLSIAPSALLFELQSVFAAEDPPVNSQTIDSTDWSGVNQVNFSGNRKTGHVFLDVWGRATLQTALIVIQIALPTFPIAEPPVLTFQDFEIAVSVTPTTEFVVARGIRVPARFSRLQLQNPSDANNTVYWGAFLRGI